MANLTPEQLQIIEQRQAQMNEAVERLNELKAEHEAKRARYDELKAQQANNVKQADEEYKRALEEAAMQRDLRKEELHNELAEPISQARQETQEAIDRYNGTLSDFVKQKVENRDGFKSFGHAAVRGRLN